MKLRPFSPLLRYALRHRVNGLLRRMWNYALGEPRAAVVALCEPARAGAPPSDGLRLARRSASGAA